METLRVNTKSDELQMAVMNCVDCGKIYRSNVTSATCPDCSAKAEKRHEEFLKATIAMWNNWET